MPIRTLVEYELKKKNPLTLGDDSNIDNNLKPFKVGGSFTGIEMSNSELHLNPSKKITIPEIQANKLTSLGDFTLTVFDGLEFKSSKWAETDDKMGFAFTTVNSSVVMYTTDADGTSADITLLADGICYLSPVTGQTSFMKDGVEFVKFDIENNQYTFKNKDDSGDYCRLEVDTAGATTLSTVDDGGVVGHLKLLPDGDLIVSGADVKLDATQKIYLDGGSDTYIHEESGDRITFTVGGDDVLELSETGTAGNKIFAGYSAIGFYQWEPVYNTSDTEVDFANKGNKSSLTFGAGNITDLNLVFPDMSCNCILLITQDGTGSRLITNYKTFDQSDGNESTVKFAGGSNPTLTTTADKTDIISFYWDNDNHRAYGTITYNF